MRDHIAKLKEAVFYHQDSARLRREDAAFALAEIERLKSRLAALISAAEPLMNWPAQDFDGKSYRTIPADLFNGFVAVVEKAKAVT